MIRVLIVDDSLVQQELLKHVLSKDVDIEIVGTASDGLDAIALVKELRPDVVTMDINMPKMNGIEATREIMSTYPVPIIVISGTTSQLEKETAFDAISAGAITIVEKMDLSKDNIQNFVQTIKLMSEVKMVKRRHHLKISKNINNKQDEKNIDHKFSLIAMGASTGGPVVLQEILSEVSKSNSFPPILIVQHITPGFIEGLADWLELSTKLPVKIASHLELISRDKIYISPDGYHMGIDSMNRIQLSNGNPENGHIPSVSFLFRSVSKVMGAKALGVLLTGMGRDGADGLKMMKDTGAFTVVQDQESSVIFGMPGEAVSLNAVDAQLPPLQIARLITGKIQEQKRE